MNTRVRMTAYEEILFLKQVRLSVTEAAILTGVPESTLRNRGDRIKRGADGKYSLDDLVDWLAEKSGRSVDPGIRADIEESARLDDEVARLKKKISELETKPKTFAKRSKSKRNQS